MCETMAMIRASNRSVNPLPSRAQGTWTSRFAASATVHARDTGPQDRPVLEEVQMAAATLLGVVRLTPGCSAFGTGERSTTQTEGQSEQIFAFHVPTIARERPAPKRGARMPSFVASGQLY